MTFRSRMLLRMVADDIPDKDVCVSSGHDRPPSAARERNWCPATQSRKQPVILDLDAPVADVREARLLSHLLRLGA